MLRRGSTVRASMMDRRVVFLLARVMTCRGLRRRYARELGVSSHRSTYSRSVVNLLGIGVTR
jgi:hypothetical protein